MGFPDQLTSQAQALQSTRTAEEARKEQLAEQTERACSVVASYLDMLARPLAKRIVGQPSEFA